MDEENITKIIERILDKKLKPILKSLDAMEKQMEVLKSVENSLQSLHEKHEELNTRVNKLDEDIKSEISNLKSECNTLRKESVKSNNTIQLFLNQMNDLEQYSRRECLEIRGIPVREDEDTNEIVKKVGNLVDVEIEDEDISISHRLPMRKNSTYDPAIIVKFTRRDIRNELYEAKKELRNKSTKDLGLGRHQEKKIYLCENLTQRNRMLFNKCLKVKKELEFKFLWSNYGKISMRKDADSRAVVINNDIDIQRLYFEYRGTDLQMDELKS